MAAIEDDRELAECLVFGGDARVREHDAPPADLTDRRGIRAHGVGLPRHAVSRAKWRALRMVASLPCLDTASMKEVIIGRTCRMVGAVRLASLEPLRTIAAARTIRRATPRGVQHPREPRRDAFPHRFA